MSATPVHNEDFSANIPTRHRNGTIGRALFGLSLVVGMIALALLGYNVVDEAFTLVAVEYQVDPDTLAIDGRPLEELEKEELVAILQEHISANLFRRFERDQPFAERSRENVLALVVERVLEPEVEATWPLTDALLNRAAIDAEVAERHEGAELEWRSWVSPTFLAQPMSEDAQSSGVRTAILGSLWMIGITLLLAFPIGVGAAIYLEEYASDNPINRVIQTNINNLAGVPSIIYGMLGLAIFVRALEPFTSGARLGVEAGTGRTLLSAALTMALLVLPIMIISAQEAIRAVPRSLRLASFGLGATKWQTIWHHVLPSALPGILTGTILATARAIGETAPLIVVGASTYIITDPTGPFSKFTVLPIQIYNWTKQPQAEFRNIAAAAIIVLLGLLLTLNATAVFLRNRFSKRY
jgi:phosphate transport system permease protein